MDFANFKKGRPYFEAKKMKYRSTRKKSALVSISQAIELGLADDGGLFVPEIWPALEFDSDPSLLSLVDLAFQILKPFFVNDPLESKLYEICKKTFNFPLPLKEIDTTTSLLELYHGATLAFKDFGARFLALCLEAIPTQDQKPRMVLVATSGDTGGAVAAAFQEFTKTPVTILYPSGKISVRQEKQLTCWEKQIQAFAVDGSFDDCQKMVKEAFQSDWWKSRYHLVSANSINIARLLPQMVYFAFASYHYQKKHQAQASFIVPSGNVGNATAALWAQKLGCPIAKIIFSHNANRTVKEYFESGSWKPLSSVSTLANAMDVGHPSNFERVRDLYPELSELKIYAEAYSVTDEQIQKVIVQSNLIFCPHTATAFYVRQQLSHGHWIIVATAHPAKFETIIEPLIQKKIDIPVELLKLLSKASNYKKIPSQLIDLQKYFN